MSWRRRVIRGVAIGLAASCLGLVSWGWVRAQQIPGHEPSKRASSDIKEAHEVMLDKARHLQSILMGFLLADRDLVITNSEAIADEIDEIVGAVLLEGSAPTEEWQIVSELSDAARQTAQLMKAGQYVDAHRQYQRMVRSCVACHQIRRTWGTMPPE